MEISKWGHVVSNAMSCVVGDGKRIKFWRNSWCSDTPLCANFPFLFALSHAKEAWVGDVWSMEKGKECWNPTFIRLFNYWELEDVERPLLHLRDKKVIKGLDDTFQWKRARNGVFSVKSLYKMLEQRPSVSFHWKCIWRSSVHPNFLRGKLFRGRS